MVKLVAVDLPCLYFNNVNVTLDQESEFINGIIALFSGKPVHTLN